MKEWESLLNSLFQGFVGEGGRFVKSKALSLLRRVVSGVRVSMLLAYAVMVLCFACALSGFASTLLYFSRDKLLELGFPAATLYGTHWPVPLWVALHVFTGTAFLLWFTSSQFFWDYALGLKKFLKLKEDDSKATQINISLGQVDEAKIVAIVDKVVEKRLHHATRRPAKEKKSA